MLDVARFGVILFALTSAYRHRFATGIASAFALVVGFAFLATRTYDALATHAIGGEYGIPFVYVGPSALPLGGYEWLPTCEQMVAAAVSAVPVVVALRRALRLGALSEEAHRWHKAAGPFMILFFASSVLGITSGLQAWVLWRQST